MLDRDAILGGPSVLAHPTSVRFADSVGGGRLHHPKMLELMHDAYEALLAANGTALPRVLAERAWGAPLTHADLELLADLRFGTPLEIVVSAAEAWKNRVTFGYRVRDTARDQVVALGRTAHAFVDLATLRRREIPDEIRAILARFPRAAASDEAAPPPRRDDLLLAPPRHTQRIIVSFEDVDAAGFVFFARTTAFFHRAYCDMRRRAGRPISEYAPRSESRALGTEADYLRPLSAGEEADVHVVSSAFADGVATIGFRIATAAGAEPVAIGTFSHSAESPVELPPPSA